MPLYLGRFSYTTDAIKGLVDNPHDRGQAAAEAFESLGAKMIGFWYAFGEFDGVFLAGRAASFAPCASARARLRYRVEGALPHEARETLGMDAANVGITSWIVAAFCREQGSEIGRWLQPPC